MKTGNWGIADVWAEAFAAQEERPLVPRSYLYATELGKAPVEVWHRMKATPPTNPPNARARMKMEAGKIVEGMVKFVLMRAGILEVHQKEANSFVDGVEVHGRLDFVAGGVPKLEQGMQAVGVMDTIDQSLARAAKAVIEHMAKNFSDGLPEQPFEIKSVGDYAMDAMEVSRRPLKNHRLQLAHYLFTLGYSSGKLTYVCRDDYRIIEHEVTADDELKKEYEEAAQEQKPWIGNEAVPPKAPLVSFDYEEGKFKKNLDVEWSNYLTMLYGFKEPREYSEIYGRKATSWNGVLKRIRDGAKMTEKNIAYIEEMKKEGFDSSTLSLLYKPGKEVTETE